MILFTSFRVKEDLQRKSDKSNCLFMIMIFFYNKAFCFVSSPILKHHL